MDGKITEYNPFNKRGKVSGPDGVHAFDAGPELAVDLSDTIIPPDPAVDITYDTAGTGNAINVELVRNVALAAPAPRIVAKSVAPPSSPKKAARKRAPKKKITKLQAKKSKKKPLGKMPTAKKPLTRKSSKESAPKRKRR